MTHRRQGADGRAARDRRLAELWDAGQTRRAIGRELGLSDEYVGTLARALGLAPRGHGWKSDPEFAPRGPTLWATRTAAAIRHAADAVDGSPTSARLAARLTEDGVRRSNGEAFTAQTLSMTLWRLRALGLVPPALVARVTAANRAAQYAAALENRLAAREALPAASPARPFPPGTRFADMPAAALARERLTERRVRRDPAELLTHSPCGSAAALCAGSW